MFAGISTIATSMCRLSQILSSRTVSEWSSQACNEEAPRLRMKAIVPSIPGSSARAWRASWGSC
eukprot:3644373-Prorocentrum_lima.AAC.1